PGQVTIWRRNGWNLNVSSLQARATLTASPLKLAVLTFPKNSSLHLLLATDPRTQSLQIDGDRGMALISFKDVSEVAHFADLAHEGELACGNAQIVNLNARLTAVADHTAPV